MVALVLLVRQQVPLAAIVATTPSTAFTTIQHSSRAPILFASREVQKEPQKAGQAHLALLAIVNEEAQISMLSQPNRLTLRLATLTLLDVSALLAISDCVNLDDVVRSLSYAI